MRTIARASMTGLVALTFAVTALGGTAGAGGSTWYFEQPSYEPGDIVRAGAAVSWGHDGTLGTPEDGPYGAWIVPHEATESMMWGNSPDITPLIQQHGRYVADVEIELGPGPINGVLYGPNVARVAFELPRVAPGFYTLVHCNWPCTTFLGDILSGAFWVGPPAPGGLATTGHMPLGTAPVDTVPPPVTPPSVPSSTAPDVTTTSSPAVADASIRVADTSDTGGVPWQLVVVVGVLIGLAVVLGLSITLATRRARARPGS